MLSAAGSEDLGKFRAEGPDEAVYHEGRGRVQGQNEIVEIRQALRRVDPRTGLEKRRKIK